MSTSVCCQSLIASFHLVSGLWHATLLILWFLGLKTFGSIYWLQRNTSIPSEGRSLTLARNAVCCNEDNAKRLLVLAQRILWASNFLIPRLCPARTCDRNCVYAFLGCPTMLQEGGVLGSGPSFGGAKLIAGCRYYWVNSHVRTVVPWIRPLSFFVATDPWTISPWGLNYEREDRGFQ